METLVSLGRYEEARACGEGALETCQRVGMDFVAYEISRALALTEAHLNQCARAASRLDVVIAQQRQMGITGVILGASYEARARIAILAGDETAFTEYAELTAKEYRYGRGSTLGARWERLMAEARRASKSALSRRASFESSAWTGRAPSATEAISESLRNASTADERAAIALRLLCEDRRATCGYLYLVDNGTGLTLVASSGSAAPPAGLSEYLREYFESETSDGGDATSALTGTQMASLAGAGPSFRDEAGTPHVPVLMTSIADGAMRHAGVAVFVEGARTPRQAGGAALVAALSAHLIELGDTHGVAV
jgi:hypothetical protein